MRRSAECTQEAVRLWGQQDAELRKWRGDAKIFGIWRIWLHLRDAITMNGRKSVQTVSAALPHRERIKAI